MSIKNRVKQLENRAGPRNAEGFCQCRPRIVDFGWGDGDGDQNDDPQICEGCGLPVEVLNVRFVWTE